MIVALLADGVYPDYFGGMQKHSYFLIKYLSRKRINIDVYTIIGSDEKKYSEYFNENELLYIRFIHFKFPSIFWFPGHYIYNSFLLSKMYYHNLKTKHYDIIYAQGFTSLAYLKKEPLKKNLISNLHGLEMFQISASLRNFFEIMLLRIPAKFILKNCLNNVSLGGSLTKIIKKYKHEESNVHVLPNGIDLSFYSPNSYNYNKKDKLKFVFVGRYERRKGVEELTDFICSVSNTNLATFSFVGPISSKKQIEDNNVKYYGLINDPVKIRNILNDSDILICPSYSEGMPTVILESMACGCAVVATDVGAISDMVDESNGWIISMPIKAGLKNVWNTIISDKSKIEEKKKQSIKKVINFSWEKITQNTFEVFQDIKSS